MNITRPATFSLILFILISFVPSAARADITPGLGTGSSGPQVTELQNLLSKLGLFTQQATGYFGAVTQAALENYQAQSGLAAVGAVTAQTSSNLNAYSAFSSNGISAATGGVVLTVGNSGSQVTSIQQALYKLGYLTSAPTGYFGAATKAAISSFQRLNGLTISGTADDRTRYLLSLANNAAPYTPRASTPTYTTTTGAATIATPIATVASVPPSAVTAATFTRALGIGSKGSDVTTLQNWLLSKGYSIPAGATGYYGQQTVNAVLAYQRSVSRPATGQFSGNDIALAASSGATGTTAVTAPVTNPVAVATNPVVSYTGITTGNNGSGSGSGSGSNGGSSGGSATTGNGGGTVLPSNPPVNPPLPAVAPTLTFTADSTSITSGGSVTFTWTSANATACSASMQGWSAAQPTAGTVTVPGITATQTYTLSCTGTGGSVSKSITVTVSQGSVPPPIDSTGKMAISMNLSPITYYSPEAAFVDAIHTSSPWSTSTHGTVTTDANGNILTWSSGTPHFIVALFEPTNGTPKQYVLTYRNNASISFAGATVVSSAPGRVVFTPRPGGTGADISFSNMSTSSPVTDVHVFRADQEALFNQGEIFNPDFIAFESQWKTLRFMDWGDTNTLVSFDWNHRATPNSMSWAEGSNPGGTPIEIMVALANEAHAGMWYNVPTEADDTYVRNAMTYIRDHLDPSLTLHVEYSNEAWNGAFPANAWMKTQAQSLWGSGGMEQTYYGYRSAQIAAIAHQVFGNVPNSRLSVVLGDQDSDNWAITNYIVPGVNLAHAGTVTQLFGEFAVAPYFATHFGYGPNAAQILAWANSGAAGVTAAINEIQHGTTVPGSSVDKVFTYIAKSAAVANTLGLRFVTYEGGPSMFYYMYPLADRPTYDTLYQNIVNDPRMKNIMTYFLNGLSDAGVKEYNHFDDIGPGSQFGFWGVVPTLDTPSSPRYDALKEAAALGNH